MSDSEKKSWWDKLSLEEQTILLTNGTLDTEKQMLDPDAYWDVRASDIAMEFREMVVDLPVGISERLSLLRFADRIDRLDGRTGTIELRAWKQGARGAATIAHRPRDGGHTEEAFLVHQQRYMASAAKDGPYAAGADCVAAAILASKREEQ